MTLATGAHLGEFEITGQLGAGGMGEVYRATDTKLGREVAIKTLPNALAHDPEHLARFEREAKLLAALNHAHIAAIHGLEEHEGKRFLVLELVEGETLAQRLEGGPLPIGESLDIALQIARALETAHDRGVIHRDLKPANVMVTPDNVVKVLDFGLAKALPSADGEAPTGVSDETSVGTVLGSGPYMSPEQARGEAAGRQSDIWSFGVVLYEMLTGISPFERPSAPETLAHVLVSEPDLAALPAGAPLGAQHLIRRCLQKDPTRRLKDIGDVRIEIEDAIEDSRKPQGDVANLSTASSFGRRAASALGIVAAVAVAGLASWWLGNRSGPEAEREVLRLALPSLAAPFLQPFGTQHIAITSDGSRVAYASLSDLSIRRLSDGSTIRVDGGSVNPFFSPDGERLGYFRDSRLNVVPAIGGTPQTIAESTERPAGAAWGPNGTIVFATTSGLYAVPDNGGAPPRLLAAPNRERGERLYAWPSFLPDGHAVLFTVVREESLEGAQVALLDMNSLETETLLTSATSAQYVPTGHLIYLVEQTLTAVPFSAEAREVRGNPVTMSDITVARAADNGAADFAVSPAGTLLYIPPGGEAAIRRRILTWIDRDGTREPLPLPPGIYAYPRVSPDGTRVAFEIGGRGNRDIWVYDTRRQSQTRLTTGPTEDMLALWSNDGRRIFFASDRNGNFDIYSQPADGSTEARVELARAEFETPVLFTPDGKELLVFEDFTNTSMLNLETQEVRPLLHRESSDRLMEMSPNGDWIAYESDEAGPQLEIFLRPYPDVMARRTQVSIDGGRYPKWGPPGSDELYYVDLDGNMMAVHVEVTPDLSLGAPEKLFEVDPPPPRISGRPYDVSAVDGRFVFSSLASRPDEASVEVSVVLHWLDELAQLVPVQ